MDEGIEAEGLVEGTPVGLGVAIEGLELGLGLGSCVGNGKVG